MKAFGWSLRDIDETDVGSLLTFINRLTAASGAGKEGPKKVYADQVDWF